MTSQFYIFSSVPNWNSMLYSWTCLTMCIPSTLFIPFPMLESLELLFSNIHPNNSGDITSNISLYSAHMKQLNISQTSPVLFITLCFCTCKENLSSFCLTSFSHSSSSISDDPKPSRQQQFYHFCCILVL